MGKPAYTISLRGAGQGDRCRSSRPSWNRLKRLEPKHADLVNLSLAMQELQIAPEHSDPHRCKPGDFAGHWHVLPAKPHPCGLWACPTKASDLDR